MTRVEKASTARELRDEGLLLREVAARMGSKPSTVHAWLHDPDGSKLRKRKDSYRTPCVECGALVSGGNGRGSRAPARCVKCANERVARTKRARRDSLVDQMIALREKGRTNWQIAEALATTPAAVAQALCRARRRGTAVAYSVTGHTAHRQGRSAA